VSVDLKDPFVQRSILVGLGLAAVLYLFFGTRLLPVCYQVRAERIRELRDEVGRLGADLARAKQTVQGLKSLETQYAELQREWERAEALLPNRSEIPEFLTGVTQSGLDCGLEVLMFEPKKETQHGFYAEKPVAVRVAGQYHQVGEFLARVASLPRLVDINRLQIRERQNEENKDQTVEAEMILSAYCLEDWTPPSDGAEQTEDSGT